MLSINSQKTKKILNEIKKYSGLLLFFQQLFINNLHQLSEEGIIIFSLTLKIEHLVLTITNLRKREERLY